MNMADDVLIDVDKALSGPADSVSRRRLIMCTYFAGVAGVAGVAGCRLPVAGCSVFTTGGHANPTLTIVQLALRLADHLNAIVDTPT